MESLRSHILFRYLWLVLAIQIFNCSVDSPDAQPDGIPEDLSINDIESIVELLAEEVFDIENAIPEHDEPDDQGLTLKKNIDLYRGPSFAIAPAVVRSSETALYHPATDGWASLPRPQPAPPPPWA